MTHTIKNGYSACAGICDTGWYGGVLVLDGRDTQFLTIPKDWTYEQRRAHARRWAELTITPRREIALVLPAGDGLDVRCVAGAERLEGPVAPREATPTPTLVWTERRAKQWHLVLFENDEVHTVLSRDTLMRCPRVAQTALGLLFAFETDTGPTTTQVEVVDQNGATRYQGTGREPLLVATDVGFVLGTEQATPDHVTLRLDVFGDAALPTHTLELREGDYLLNADVAWSASGECLFVAAESTPRWGYSCQIGLHRTIHAWQWRPGQAAEALGALPVEHRAFKSIGMENLAPIRPTLLVEDGAPVVLFKQHRYTGFRAFGWDCFWCRRDGDSWTEPMRITSDTTTSDASFGLVRQGNDYVGLFPAHENEGGNGSKQSADHRVDRVTFGPAHRLERFEVPAENAGEYRIPPACKEVAPEPPALSDPYEGRQLVWGDLHIHTVYSKCVAAVDGDVRENIRFAREVLGCRVFAIAEHTPHTTGIESTWLYDRLEATAGAGNVVLYAMEPGCHRTRHMNLYSRDRKSFEKLERIVISQAKHYPEILRQLREDLPHDAVYVMRHVHGHAIPDEQIPQHFDPHFEVAMEAMQGRGNAMLGVVENSPIFPNSFLDAGCKIGLVGGTDHFREWAPNHFCLTGFWVKEVSPDGVWEALRNRYTTAMSDSRVAMVTRCKGIPMGRTVTLTADEPLRVSAQASCGHPIQRVTLMRDGELLPWTDVRATSVSLDLADEAIPPGKHWYVVTAEVDTGHGPDNTGICHASPYFVWKQS